jgi:hypothetical protein
MICKKTSIVNPEIKAVMALDPELDINPYNIIKNDKMDTYHHCSKVQLCVLRKVLVCLKRLLIKYRTFEILGLDER